MKDTASERLNHPMPKRRLTGLSVVPPQEDGVEFLGLFRALWVRKTLIGACGLIAALVFFIGTTLQERSFVAVATVMLDPREQQVVATQDQVVSDLKLSSPILESEVAIIRSATLLKSAVEGIGLDRFDQIDPAMMPPSLWQRGMAFLSQPSSEMPTSLTAEDRRVARIIGALRQDMSVRRIGDSYVIEISIATPDPVLSADTANALAHGYIERQLQDRRRVAESATAWLAEQVAGRRDDLTLAETAVETFKQGQLDKSISADAILEEHLTAVNEQLVAARAARSTEAARLQQIEKLTGQQGALAAAETQASPLIIAMRTDRAEKLQQDLRLAGTVGPLHPDRKVIAAEVTQLETDIGREVANIAQNYRNEISVLQITEATLEQEVSRLQATLAGNAASTLDLRQLEREAEAARETYEEMLTRLGETRAQAEIQRAEARMVNVAQVPVVPSSPRVKLMTAFGATLGLTLGMMAALSLEMVSAGFISSAQLERVTGLPVLTTIPREPLTKPSAVLDKVTGQGFSLFAERIRQLRTMLEMGGDHDGPHAIAVLSSLPNEGKTTTALALARSYALTGKTTLLLDLDTRRSELTQHLTQSRLTDLGDYLAGDAALSDAIYHDETLGFSLAGSSRYAAILADSVSPLVLQDVLEALRKRFEVIVIDTPPVLAVSDGLEIASVADTVIYLVQHRKTSRKSASYGLSALHHVGLRPTGLVMTKAQAGSDPDNYPGGYTYG